MDWHSLVIKPEAAKRQLEAEKTEPEVPGEERKPVEAVSGKETHEDIEMAKPAQPRRFHGSVRLDATCLGRDAGKIAEEVVQHLSGLVGAEVEVTLEISTKIPDGAPEHVVRTVTENCNTLHFTSYGFEED